MAIARYLAMTAQEFVNAPSVPEKMAWMACHFSPYSIGLCNFPKKIPANSLLILNDSTPPAGQAPKLIAELLRSTLQKHDCFGLLLDFQRPSCPQTQTIAEELIKLEFPVCVSECYAKNLDCPVFLPPLPLSVPISEYIAPWKGRKIWLDVALSCEKITVTEKGSTFSPISTALECALVDEELHCHYRIDPTETGFSFTLQRTKEDLVDLLAEAEALGICVAVGLYQELK